MRLTDGSARRRKSSAPHSLRVFRDPRGLPLRAYTGSCVYCGQSLLPEGAPPFSRPSPVEPLSYVNALSARVAAPSPCSRPTAAAPLPGPPTAHPIGLRCSSRADSPAASAAARHSARTRSSPQQPYPAPRRRRRALWPPVPRPIGLTLAASAETGFPHFQQKRWSMRASASSVLHVFHTCGRLCG